MANLENRYQTQARRVLCLCSAGMLRSPTVAWVLSNPPYNFNTRAAGLTTEYALIPVDDALVFWANDVIVMDHDMKCHVEAIIDNSQWKDDFEHPNIFVWKIPDMYDYRQPELISLIEDYAEKEYNIPGLILTKVPDG
jgi:predicted protein tyrosine phosphatase